MATQLQCSHSGVWEPGNEDHIHNTIQAIALFPGLQSSNAVGGLVKLLRRMMSGRHWVDVAYNNDATSHRFQTFLAHLSGGFLKSESENRLFCC